MGRLAVGVLLVGIALSFHDTLWVWAGLALVAWASLVAVEMRFNPNIWK
jgi:hypothetical protein